MTHQTQQALSIVFGAPISILCLVGVVYLVSCILAGPIIMPLAISWELDIGVLWTFLAYNGIGVAGVALIVYGQDHIDIDAALFSFIVQAGIAFAVFAYLSGEVKFI